MSKQSTQRQHSVETLREGIIEVVRRGVKLAKLDEEKKTSHRHCDMPGCKQSAPFKIKVLGHPHGWYCRNHRRELEEIWDGAHDAEDAKAAA